MKVLMLVGFLLLVLGVVSFFMPFPHSEHHGVKIGDDDVRITTRHHERVSPVVGIVLVVTGAGLMIAGGRKS